MVMAGTAYNNEQTRHPQLYKFNGNEVLDNENLPNGLNLMNFNARLYNPALGVFLAVDPQGQFSNPYLAFGNNPTSFIDPNGEFAFVPFLIAAAIGAGIGGVGYVASVAFSEGGFKNWDFGNFLQSIAIGAISGAAGYGVGGAFGAVGSQGVIGELGRAAFHGVSNQIIGAGFGIDQNFASFASGALGSLSGSALHKAGPFAQIGGSALSGGVGAEISGGDFWRGAATGATVASLNHLAHLGQDKPKHPGKLNLKDVSDRKIARHLVKGIRYHTKTNTDIDLIELFDCLENTCHYRSGTHISGRTEIILNDQKLNINFELPFHGPKSGLRSFDPFGYRTHYSGDGLWNLSYGHFGISLTIHQNHEQLLRNYLGIN